ncbi:MAG: hypothetical protein JXA21_26670, partial [Anaerolineae bacterium]|nr:hypothetical protein [Anaerolineae bacterium]
TTAAVSITFPPGNWPWYAQGEITVKPEPPLVGRPTEICATVVNQDPTAPHPATLEFRIANFGIGVPFTPIGVAHVVVPPGGVRRGCVVWVPPQDGHWCIEVLLRQPGADEPLRSQRNIDVWEPLVPGGQHTLRVPVGPLETGGMVTFSHSLMPNGWDLAIEPSVLEMPAGQQRLISVTTFVPRDIMLGTRQPIVDVEGFLDGVSIGGFRKMDNPPVILHQNDEPFFAESEISITPYPPRAGEPVQICAEVYNLSDMEQTIEVQFSWANFGIGLPFQPINGPINVVVPPHSHKRVCVNWVPRFSGHFCVQAELFILGNVPYQPQFSQRNFDVNEPLEPGVPHASHFEVGNFQNNYTNPDPILNTLWLEADVFLEGWGVEFDPSVLPPMEPGTSQWVTMTVTPPVGTAMPPDGTPILDVRAMVDDAVGGHAIGGFRKIYRPAVPLHTYPDPTYAEREIKVHPYPPLAGEPTEICVELRNPTNVPQDVQVQFYWANFGVGLLFQPIDGLRPVHLPPNSVVNECIQWVPPFSGHFCMQVELFGPNQEKQYSQRNIDVDEPLQPGETDTLSFPVGNPFNHPVTITLGLIPRVPGWEFALSEDMLFNVPQGETRMVSLTVKPPMDQVIPEDDTPIVDVEAYVDGVLIGGFRKIHRPPVPLHPYPDPPYAEREITVEPYPPRAGEPVEICVELRNPTAWEQHGAVQFSWANFGMGVPFTPINGQIPVTLAPFSTVKRCIHWVPPTPGHFCVQVELFMDDHRTQRSQRNLDVDEPLRPNTPHSATFLVGNPFDHPVTITLGLLPHLPDWEISLSEEVLPDMEQGESREVTLTVTPPDALPADGQTVVDVEAYVEGQLIGGFRKIFRPDVPIHHPADPIYAEREITVDPYPPRAGEPVEICVELRNPTAEERNLMVQFSWANFGVGLPFTPINGQLPVTLAPFSTAKRCIHWVPPTAGHFCVQVELFMAGAPPQRSQRNLDVSEPLQPNTPHSATFPVGNPFYHPVTITLGLVPHLPDWEIALSQDVLPNMDIGEVREVTLTVTPPDTLPADGQAVVDVEAYAEGRLIGGFRKIFRPDVPVHKPKDPVYAESEIGVDPYPVVPGHPVKLSVEVFNPTNRDRIVTATFSIAQFGIGLPFNTANIAPNPVRIFVPAHGAARGHVIWTAPNWQGKFCVQVMIEVPGHDPVWSRRNIDVGEPLRPGQPHALVFPVGVWPYQEPATITLGLIPHLDGWQFELSDRVLPNVQPGHPVPVTLTVTPPADAQLGTGRPIVDVEAFVNGELLGGIRKLDRPPVPIHKPHEKDYAETELSVEPYPPKMGQESRVSSVVQNTGPDPVTVTLMFGWAQFGMGIPFTTTGMNPAARTISIAPAMSATAWVSWTPAIAGHQCLRVRVVDPDGTYQDQISQRNVDVVQAPPCGFTREYSFTIYNDAPYSVTVDLGLITFNVPAHWIVTTEPSGAMEIEPYSSGVVKVIIEIPCVTRQSLSQQQISQLQQEAGSVPIIDVEGYVDGELIGGVEIQVTPAAVAEPGVELSPGGARTALPGANVHYTHVLTNTGTTTDTFILTHASSQGWDVGVSASTMGQTTILPIQMGAGMTATIMATVTVPAGAVAGTVDTTLITATSQTTPTVFATAYNVTTVGSAGQIKIYLPLVLRNQ